MTDPQNYISAVNLVIDALGYLITLDAALIIAIPLIQNYLPSGPVRVPRVTVFMLLLSLLSAALVMVFAIGLGTTAAISLIANADTLIVAITLLTFLPFIFFVVAILIYITSHLTSHKALKSKEKISQPEAPDNSN
jgi:hypothetical protein